MQTEPYKVRKYVFEIFEDIAKSNTQKEAAEKLKKYNKELPRRDAIGLNDLFRVALDPDVMWLIPQSEPPYRPADENAAPCHLLTEMGKRILYFIENPKKIESRSKREALFIQFLESVHPKDAKIVLDAVKKEINYKHVTPTVIRMALGDTFFTAEKKAARLAKQQQRAKAA